MSAYVTSVLAIMGINVMLAVSLNMISGFCGQFSLGHAAFYGAGAYGAAFFAAAGTPLPVALLAGVIVAGLLGLVVGFAALRLRADFLAVTTIGVSFLFVGFVRKQPWLGAEMGISRIPASGLGSEGDTLLIIACAFVTVAASLYVSRSWMGFAFRAVGDDEETARTIAIPVSSYKLVAFTLGTAIAGLAGGLYAYFTQFIVPETNTHFLGRFRPATTRRFSYNYGSEQGPPPAIQPEAAVSFLGRFSGPKYAIVPMYMFQNSRMTSSPLEPDAAQAGSVGVYQAYAWSQ